MKSRGQSANLPSSHKSSEARVFLPLDRIRALRKPVSLSTLAFRRHAKPLLWGEKKLGKLTESLHPQGCQRVKIPDAATNNNAGGADALTVPVRHCVGARPSMHRVGATLLRLAHVDLYLLTAQSNSGLPPTESNPPRCDEVSLLSPSCRDKTCHVRALKPHIGELHHLRGSLM